MYKKIPYILFSTLILTFAFAATSFAGNKTPDRAPANEVQNIAIPVPEAPKEVCGFEVPAENEKFYDAQVITVRKKMRVELGEIFRTKVFIKNTGNMPWFSDKSKCLGPRMYLGTDKDRDRSSAFYLAQTPEGTETNWKYHNRIRMDQLRVDPGEIASFTFYSKASDNPDVYKEYLTPMLDAIQWIDNATFSYELIMGDVDESPVDIRKQISYANSSGSVLSINLDGERLILVDLSDQTMSIYLDDQLIRDFRVSTGAPSTPTPTGTTEILLKQEVRVGGKAPHYIMPKFQMFRSAGYGLHALPSLGGDGGVFWTEARNHIGIPVSHGCIRLLPEEADWLYDFTEVGDTVTVQW